MPKVLIIDDRRENIVYIANSILKPMGYEVVTARDGQSGLQKVEQEAADLIITDLKLPRMGGLELLEQVDSSRPARPSQAVDPNHPFGGQRS